MPQTPRSPDHRTYADDGRESNAQAATTSGSQLNNREREHIHRLTAAGEDVWVVSSSQGGFSLPGCYLNETP